MDSSRIEAHLGWKPRHDLAHGLKKTVRWYLENRGWVDGILKQQNYQGWMEENYTNRKGSQ